MLSNIYIGIYALLWIFITVLYIYKTKTIGIGGLLLIIYSVSSLASIFYFNALDGVLHGNMISIEFAPLIFLFICLNICMLPIYIHSKQLAKLKVRRESSRIMSFFKILLTILAPIIIEAFLEMLYVASKINPNELSDIYESENRNIVFPFVGEYTTGICKRLQFIWPIFFFVFLENKKDRIYAFLALMAYLVIVLYSYANAGRVGIVKLIFTFILVFILFRNNIDTVMRKKILKRGLIMFLFFVLMLGLITVSRYGASNMRLDIVAWISLYLGEAPINFSQYLWTVNNTMEGDNMFSMAKTLIGMDAITDVTLRREHWTSILGIPNNIFYSWIGDVYLDIGRILTLFFCVVFCFCLEMYIRKIMQQKSYNLFSILIMSMILLVFMFGFMYFPYKVYGFQILIVSNVVFLLICQFINRKYK